MASRALVDALAPLWQLPFLAPGGLSSTEEFVRLRETCEILYPEAGRKTALEYGLGYGLKALGLPCAMSSLGEKAALTVEAAAVRLDAAFRKTHANRVYLCPLDCADDLPELSFGPHQIGKLSAAALEEIVDLSRLKRFHPGYHFASDRFSEFTWLVVRETVALDMRVGARAIPILFHEWSEDFGAIDPHERAFPTVVETALAFMMLVPWEEWVASGDVEWRGFRIPWFHTADDDIFSRPTFPPPAGSLSWQPDIVYDHQGDEIDLGERPAQWSLAEQGSVELPLWINDSNWLDFTNALASPLLASPVLHFVLRAFRSRGIDEFLAHTTVIDAAFGLHVDHLAKERPKFPEAKMRDPGATVRLVARLSAILDHEAGEVYRALFNTRSEFVHGRGMGAIPGIDRLQARQLARRATVALCSAATGISDRDKYLNDLLAAGLG